MNVLRRAGALRPRLPEAARIAGFSDQALFSLATLAQTYVYAKALPAEAFGVFGLVQGTCLLVQGLQRGVSVLPMIMTSRGESADILWQRLDRWMRGIVCAVLVALWLLAPALGVSAAFRTAFALSALCTLSTLTYEFERRCLFLQQRSRGVLAAAGVYFAAVALSMAIVGIWFRTITAAAFGLFAAAALAAGVGRACRHALAPTGLKLREHTGIIFWNMLSFLPYSVYNNGMILIVGALVNVRAVALFTASRLFIAPIQTLLQAVDSTDKPRARRMFAADGPAGLELSLGRTRRVLLGIGLPYLVGIAALAPFVATLLFRNRFPGLADAIRCWSGVAVAMLLVQPLETGLLVLHRSNAMFHSRLAAGVAAVITLLALSRVLPMAAPILALLVGWGLGGVVSWQAYRRYLAAARG